SPLAYVTNANPVNNPPEWLLPARLDRVADVLCALRSEPFEVGERLVVEGVEIRGVVEPAKFDEPVGQLLADAIDVHGRPPDEVVNATLELGRAGGVGAVAHGLARLAADRLAARRAMVRHCVRD